MASVGPQLATAGAHIAGVESDWTNPGNVASTSSYATCDLSGGTPPAYSYLAYVTTNGTARAGTNQGGAGQEWTTSVVEETVGSSSNLWGRAWSLADIKGNSSFGLLLSIIDTDSWVVSDDLCAKGFDFSTIPDGSTINGVEFKYERRYTSICVGNARNVRCTVTYTAGGGGGGGTGAAVNHYRNQGMR